MSFAISDKVVSLKTQTGSDSIYAVEGPTPVKGTVYVIEAVLPYDSRTIGLRLVGSTVYCQKTRKEVGWDSSNFRKLADIQAENRLTHSIIQS